MLKTNVRDRIRQTNYFLARLSKQCLQVHAEHSGQLQISYLLASTMSGLPHRYPIIYSLVRIRDIASQLSTYSVCSSKGKIARQLDKAMQARQIAHNTTQHLASSTQLAAMQVLGTTWTPQLGYLQLASWLPNLAWLFLGGLARLQSINIIAGYLTQLGYFQVVQLGYSL